ncbi:unnamed protein product [Peronospora belbahrii]|uniref:Uncharacterized protein n=1 Tax=Peronospora belbahrii TaxID=622444 RepID=A0AAU9L5Y9_9STRA|nr:unnamed protein product [Peronospora belbahrii]
MRTTLNDGVAEIQRAVGETVSLGVSLAADVRDPMPVEASQLVAHTTAQPTKPSVGAHKGVTHLCKHEVDVVVDKQSRGTMVYCPLPPHKQCCILRSVIVFTAGGEVV